MSEHLFDLIDPKPGLNVENLRNQILQQMPHFLCNPVCRIFFRRYDIKLVIIQIPGRSERGNAENRSSVAAANSLPAIFQPFFFRQIGRIHKNKGPICRLLQYRHAIPPSLTYEEQGVEPISPDHAYFLLNFSSVFPASFRNQPAVAVVHRVSISY